MKVRYKERELLFREAKGEAESTFVPSSLTCPELEASGSCSLSENPTTSLETFRVVSERKTNLE